METRKSLDSRYVFNQGFYIPVPHCFITVKIEVIQMESVGWLSRQFREHILESFDFRLPDVNKDPFTEDGSIILPIRDRAVDFKKFGLQPIQEMQKGGGLDAKVAAAQALNASNVASV